MLHYKLQKSKFDYVLFSVCGAFVTGDNEGYVTMWDAGSKRRLVEVLAR